MIISPWQTIGPFFNRGLLQGDESDLTNAGSQPPDGQIIEVTGVVFEETGNPVPSAVLEIWQANAQGRYDHPGDQSAAPLDPNFKGFGRAISDIEGVFRFRTIMPGPVPGPGNTLQAPHLAMSIHSAGLLRRLITRVYFDGNSENADDPILNSIDDTEHRATLIAKKRDGADNPVYEFNIKLRGDGETAFFED